ncbi:Predicted PurR-regulated permease PerM [Pelagirhabdus alkalitolerans]|uniref:Predicted PurR-regulated permease PerM n=1 Tax=Pelagirhabdus alkalitolerans TaxID=1612202 RepID=A0A1G6GI84_9BACI|nr:AI-2E family transporter [Pelagirhabdus alkalitolerans]SDB81732.1 Predicted PurR-regulated permease PerM [Pelagirhabdus alkalitolerans]
MTEQKPFRFLAYAILVFTLIFLLNLTGFIFRPVGTLIAAIAVPIVGAGLLFYLTNPLVNLLEKFKIKRIYGVLAVFIILISVVYFSIYFIIPPIQEQFARLSDNAPAMVDSFDEIWQLWQNRQEYIPETIEESIENVINNIEDYFEQIASSLFGFIGSLFSFVFSFLLIPFFLFFMLKDSGKFIPFATSFFSKSKADSLETLLQNINRSLAAFIQGQALVSLCVGIMLYIGYIAVGLNYALMLAVFGLFMNLIPFVGPWLSAIPAVIIGFFQDPLIGLWTAIIMIVAQQIESNLISPNVMGKVLKVHPLTVITLILAAGAIAGFLGLLFAVPAYAVAKTIVSHFYHVYTDQKPVGHKNLF